MDTGRLGRGEMIAGVCAALLFIVMFFAWFRPRRVSVSIDQARTRRPGRRHAANAWQSFGSSTSSCS